ncbi:MAG: ABC transporter permease [Methylobacteriaceae bacterium]|jgi:simple sugar transport system permease protein|nr:ABC transporter permease [Methylobacteriaceae bacterium]
MRIELSRRPDPSPVARALAPVFAAVLVFALGAVIVYLMGKSPSQVFYAYIVYPLSDAWGLEQIIAKATPLALIAVGLSYCARANLWNIGAEGQYTMGAIFGGWLAIHTHGTDAGYWVWPTMLVLGALGGMLWGLVPALLKTRYNVNEILSSLMLVYVVQQLLDYLGRGPWRDPQGRNMPNSAIFDGNAIIPSMIDGTSVHYETLIALLVVLISAVVFSRTVFGYRIRLTGDAPRAAHFAGYDNRTTTLIVFAISGALAGLAGIAEISGTNHQILAEIRTGYGFTSIIVAFLGRLNPIGILFASLVLSLSVIGGQNAQLMVKLPYDLTSTFQGLLLMFILAADAMVSYRLHIFRGKGRSHAV